MDTTDQKRLQAIAARRLEILKRNECFDPYNLDSRPNKKQLEIIKNVDHLHIYVVAGNQSGKSQLGARIVAWKFLETHPYWKRNKSWGDEPLFIIVSGKNMDQVEALWETKIRPFLPEGCFKVRMKGGILNRVVHNESGNTILFTSHMHAKESTEKAQSYVAHHVWLDEMPNDYHYIEELHRRVDAREAQFLATFTPKRPNPQIRRIVDSVDPLIGIKYGMNKLDNPIYQDRKEAEIKKLNGLPLMERNTILYGDWQDGDSKVFRFDVNEHTQALPPGYRPTVWPHILSIDPAARGKAGLVIAASDPHSPLWYVVKAKYLEGKAPSDLVLEAEQEARGYNIQRRVYDPHETGYMLEAVKCGLSYIGVYNKQQRKLELITNVQQALRDQWLIFIPELVEMMNELDEAEWNTNGNGIKNSTNYHLLDALQYLIDNKMPKEEIPESLSYDAMLIAAARASRIADEQALKQKTEELTSGRKQFNVTQRKRRKRRWML